MEAAIMTILPSLISATGSVASGILSRPRTPKQGPLEKRKMQLVDELLGSLNGGGKYGDLFSTDKAAFESGVADPMRQRFNTQTAPQIQQQYIASGMQRGTGLEDSLTRAGVDMDQMINQAYFNYINQQKQNKQGVINQILGLNMNQPQGQPAGEAFQQAAGGALSGYQNLGNDVTNLLKASFGSQSPSSSPVANPISASSGQQSSFSLPGFNSSLNQIRPRQGFYQP